MLGEEGGASNPLIYITASLERRLLEGVPEGGQTLW